MKPTQVSGKEYALQYLASVGCKASRQVAKVLRRRWLRRKARQILREEVPE